MKGSYWDPSTVEYCERCRCKTWHILIKATGERYCEHHLPPESSTATEQRAPAGAEGGFGNQTEDRRTQ